METVQPYSQGTSFEVQDTPEFKRILNLPRRDWEEAAQLNELYKRMTAAFKMPAGTQEFRLIQASALADAHDQKGLVAPIRVGEGKTLLTFLLPTVIPGIQRPVLLVPAALIEKTWREFQVLRKHWVCHPSYMTRKGFDEAVISYEILGRDSGKDKLNQRRPDLLTGDECHKLRNRQAACTKRVERFMLANPDTIFCGMSGTITKRSVRDYWHLLYWALKHQMPLPRVEAEMEKWAEALDEKKTDAEGRRGPGALFQFCNEEERAQAAPPARTAPVGRTQQMPTFLFKNKLKAARQGYQRRLRDTPGVICSPDRNLDCSLVIRRVDVDPGPTAGMLLDHMREESETPNGDLVVTPMDMWRHARELACGFFYSWWDQKGFSACLAKTLSQDVSLIAPDRNAAQSRTNFVSRDGRSTSPKNMRHILSECVLVTEKDIALVKALGSLPPSRPISSPGTAEPGTASPLNNTRSFSQSSMGRATSANANAVSEVNAQGVDATVSRLITATRRVALGDSSAHLVTERSACWAIVLRAYPELLPILRELVSAALPPAHWMKARKAWNWSVRQILDPEGVFHSRYVHLNLDSPMQVGLAVAGVDYENDDGIRIQRAPTITDPGITQAYERWRDVRGDYTIHTVAEWVDDSTLKYCLDWMKREGPGIVWTEHRAFGIRLAEMLGTGFCSNGGQDAGGKTIEDYEGRPVVASVQANHGGRNLQAWNKNLIVTAVPTGSLWEQLIGRTHRPGQEADTVFVDWICACDEQDQGFQQLMADAQYIQDTTGQSQKLLYADHV